MTGPDPAIPFTLLAADGTLDAPALDDAEHHHLARVRRLRPGAAVTVGDGAGRWRRVRLTAGSALEVDGAIESAPRPAPPVAVGFALTKGDRPELVVQKLTELGVDVVVPFTAERSVVRWDADKAARNVERWKVVAREAAAQSHRPWLPAVEPVATFADLAARPTAVLAAADGGPPTLDDGGRLVLIGPEGGWSEAELAALRGRLSLGPHVLRAETAAIAAGTLLVALREQMVRTA